LNVPVEHSHGPKALQISQRALAIACGPAPLRIDRPEWNVRKDNNRRGRSEIFHVSFKPLELIVSELTQAAGLEIQDIDQYNKMDTVFVKAVPARAFAFDALQITFTVKLSSIVKHIVLPGNIENVLGSAALEHFIESVELFGLRQLCNISRVNKERGRPRHCVDAIESNFEGRRDIFIRFLTETDVTIADLQKAQVGSR